MMAAGEQNTKTHGAARVINRSRRLTGAEIPAVNVRPPASFLKISLYGEHDLMPRARDVPASSLKTHPCGEQNLWLRAHAAPASSRENGACGEPGIEVRGAARPTSTLEFRLCG